LLEDNLGAVENSQALHEIHHAHAQPAGEGLERLKHRVAVAALDFANVHPVLFWFYGTTGQRRRAARIGVSREADGWTPMITRTIEHNEKIQNLVFKNTELLELYRKLGYCPYLSVTVRKLTSEVESLMDHADAGDTGEPVKLAPRDRRQLELLLSMSAWDFNKFAVLPHPWEEARRCAAEIRRLLGTGENAIEAGLVRELLRSALLAVDPANLPEQQAAQKRDLDFLLFRVVDEIPNEFEGDNRARDLSERSRAALSSLALHGRVPS
jgi:hypothetical protein